MIKLLKKIIRVVPVVVIAIALLLFFIGIPVIMIYTEGLWIATLLLGLFVSSFIIMWFCVKWFDELEEWAKE